MPHEELRAGGLDDSHFADSLAEEMEKALNQLREEDALGPLPEEGRRDRRMLFVAIARGVVAHLVKRERAFVISQHNGGVGRHTTNTDGYVHIKAETP